MKKRKHLYDKAKQTNTHTDWCAYNQARNEVNSLLEMHIAIIALNCLKVLVHAKSGSGHILKIKKDHFGVAPLNDGGTILKPSKRHRF